MYKLRETLYNGSIKSTKEHKMIRTILGFILVFGAVGGMDNATDGQLIPLLTLAVVGLVLMYFGTTKINAK
jgi:hypothetical protein